MCRKFIVHGKVQGVFFRASSRDEALKLRLSGHAINCNDGTVEILVCGDEAKLSAMVDWLHDGPPLARVQRVAEQRIDCVRPKVFSTA